MEIRKIKTLGIIFLFFSILNSPTSAKDKIVQQQEMSFDLCLSVINTSETKLSISPEITDNAAKLRVAVFKLIDGALKIKCDGEKGVLTVTTSTK